MTYDFVNFDDGLYVTGNPTVKKGITWDGFLWAWQSNVASNWHPLTVLSHMLDCEVFGLNAKGHHLTSLLLHLASVWLLFEVLRRMTGSPGKSAVVAALFGIHPTHVESVAWIAERKDVLSGLFFVLTLGAYLRYTRERTAGRYLLVALTFALGLLSKPMLVTLPCVLLLLDVWPLRRLPVPPSGGIPWRGLRPLLLEKVPLLLLSVAASAVTVYTQTQSMASTQAVSIYRRVANALVSYTVYLGKTIWPAKLAVFYPLPPTVPLWKAVAAGTLLLAITLFVAVRFRRSPWLAVGWLWFLGMMVPVIGLVQVGRQAMADRYTYLPTIGLFLMAAWGLSELLEERRWRRAALATASALAVGALAAAAWVQVGHWQNSLTLFRHTAAVTRNNYLAHLNLASALAKTGARDEAMKHYREALRIQPSFVEGNAGLGSALYRWGRPREALPYLRRAVRLRPNSARMRHSLAVNLEALGRTDEAVTELRKAVELSPNMSRSHHGLGAILHKAGRTDEALQHYRKALDINPGLTELYNPTTALLAQRGQLAEAVRLFAEVVDREPDLAAAHYHLAILLQQTGRSEEARRHLVRALELDPGLAPRR
ncbi:MAG TPA: tetratricopeptide repeat protein [Thermoanaerobaculia bacterium]